MLYAWTRTKALTASSCSSRCKAFPRWVAAHPLVIINHSSINHVGRAHVHRFTNHSSIINSRKYSTNSTRQILHLSPRVSALRHWRDAFTQLILLH